MKTRKKLNVWLAMSMFLLAMACATAAGGTIYVDADASGANNGSSWTDAYRYLQDGLAVAWSGDEIRVAQGIYKPDEDSAHPNGTGSRTATFQLINGVAIRGGYAGFGEPDPNARDIKVYETVLSGDLLGNDGPDFANNGENSYHVVKSDWYLRTVTDGFTITAGNANGSYPDNCGSGMYNESGSPTVTNCTFSSNSAGHGGGMNNYNSSTTLTNCTFSGNSARWGGGIGNHNSDPMLTNCTFSGNSAESGGGMYNGGISNPTLTNCIFWGNSDDGGVNESAQIHTGGIEEPVINYSCIQGWTGALGGTGNIDADPCFVEPGYWADANDPNIVVEPDDSNAVRIEGDYHLLEDSPCIDAGTNTPAGGLPPADMDGNPRPLDGDKDGIAVADMGAYEFVPNVPPVACIVGGDRIVECEGCWGARVTLDGSCSSDADSAPGTNDDIAHFDWYKVDACDPNFEDFLASGEIIDCNLPLGEHIIALEVIDKADAFDTNEVTIIVQDTTPPEFALSVTPTTLWPANHKMVLIRPSWTASDICDASPEVSLVSITMNEDGEAKGNGHTTLNIQIGDDGSIYLRAERSGAGSGRIYTITYQAVDDSGNVAVASATVTVPHDQR